MTRPHTSGAREAAGAGSRRTGSAGGALPHSYRSVCRRFAITTNASRCASRAISPSRRSPAGRGGSSSRRPMASPRSVTGASTTQGEEPPAPEFPRRAPRPAPAVSATPAPPARRRTAGPWRTLLHPPLVTGGRSADGDPVGVLQLEVRKADERPARQVGDEERDLRRAERQAKLAGDGFDGFDGRGRLRGRQDAARRLWDPDQTPPLGA